MKNTQNITIVMLLMCAIALTTLLVAGWVYTGETAYATATDRGGDYIIATGAFDDTQDVVYVLDIANAKLNLYYPDVNTNQLQLGTSLNLGTAFR